MITDVAADAATAPPNSAAGYRPDTEPVRLSITTSVRVRPPGPVIPAVTTPGHARTEMIAAPAGAGSVTCQSCWPLRNQKPVTVSPAPTAATPPPTATKACPVTGTVPVTPSPAA